MTFHATVAGLDALAADLDQVAGQLDELPGAGRASQLIADKARSIGPRRTGALLATVAAVPDAAGELQVVAGGSQVDYAVPVHAVNPFIARAAHQTEQQWLELLDDELQQLLDRI